MTALRVLLDSAVPLYAAGAESKWKAPCLAVMDAVATGAVDAHASIEAIQEYAHHRLRRTGSPKVAAAEARDLRALVQELAFDSAVLDRALDLMAGSAVRGRNAVHAATASVHGIDHIISPDAAFDALAWLTRLDPLTFAPVRAS